MKDYSFPACVLLLIAVILLWLMAMSYRKQIERLETNMTFVLTAVTNHNKALESLVFKAKLDDLTDKLEQLQRR